MNADLLQQLKTFVGPQLDLLLHNKEATEPYLDDPDPRMRWAAVILMTDHWAPTDAFKIKCENMAANDSDEGVRAKAIGCLGTCFAGTGERRIERFLAQIVLNDAQTYPVRRSAYAALLFVNGAYRMPSAGSMLNLNIEQDVDWDFVRSMES
jgi:hypothetical protein